MTNIPAGQDGIEPGADQIAAWRSQYGEVEVTRLGGQLIVMKQPSRDAWRRFMTEAADPQKRMSALDNVVKDATVWPDRTKLDAFLGRKLSYAAKLADVAAKLTGADDQAETVKL